MSESTPQKVIRSDVRFPAYSLKDCVAVADSIYKRGGGSASPDQLAAFLDYKSPTNGAYLARIGAAKAYGLITKSGHFLVPTALSHRIISPVYLEDAKQSTIEAFFNVDLFKKLYDDFKGKELPPETGLKNALQHNYGVIASRVDVAYRTFMESADYAGFFLTRGSRSHLVIPSFSNLPPQSNSNSQDLDQDAEPNIATANNPTDELNDNARRRNTETVFNGANSEQVERVRHPLIQDVKAKYLNTLIELFEAKSSKGEVDEKLMERIERLLDGA